MMGTTAGMREEDESERTMFRRPNTLVPMTEQIVGFTADAMRMLRRFSA